MLAIGLDYAASAFVVIAVVGFERYLADQMASLWVMGVFLLQSTLLTWLVGGSFGKLVTRLRVVPADGRMLFINPLRIVARQIAIVLVIPPLVFKPDGRGLHDLLAGTATVPLATFRELMARMPSRPTGG